MKFNKLKQLLLKYQQGSATDAERHIVDQWYDSLKEHKLEIPGLLGEKDKMITKKRIWDNVDRQQRPKVWSINRIIQIAATIAMIMGAWWFIYLPKDDIRPNRQVTMKREITTQHITTDVRQQKKVWLPDSSVVWLNANTTLDIPPGYGRGKRHVHLSGEAFFDIKRDTSSPFIVLTDDIQVAVLGTSFNVRSYPTSTQIKVSVNSGKVQVRNNQSSLLSDLNKGDNITYHKSSGSHKTERNTVANNSLWREGHVILDAASFEELAQNIHNLYGVHLMTDNELVSGYRYTLTLTANMGIEEAMDLICTISNKRYRKEETGEIYIF